MIFLQKTSSQFCFRFVCVCNQNPSQNKECGFQSLESPSFSSWNSREEEKKKNPAHFCVFLSCLYESLHFQPELFVARFGGRKYIFMEQQEQELKWNWVLFCFEKDYGCVCYCKCTIASSCCLRVNRTSPQSRWACTVLSVADVTVSLPCLAWNNCFHHLHCRPLFLKGNFTRPFRFRFIL